jgi:hypothetical protein
MGLVDQSFRQGRGWKSLTRLSISDIHNWLMKRPLPNEMSPQGFPCGTVEIRTKILMEEVAPHLDNIRALSIVAYCDIVRSLMATFSDGAVMALAKKLISQCSSVELIDDSMTAQPLVQDLLQDIDRSKIEHLHIHSANTENTVEFFSLRRGKPLTKLQTVHIGFTSHYPLADPVAILYGLSQMTGDLKVAEISSQHRDRANDEAFYEVIQRLVSKNPHLTKLILPSEHLEFLFPQAQPNLKKTKQKGKEKEKEKEKEKAEIDFALVEKTVLDTYHLPLDKLRLGSGLFDFFVRRIENEEKLGSALASLWQLSTPIPTSLRNEIAGAASLYGYQPSLCKPMVCRFIISAAESFLDSWETDDGSPANFLLLLSLIDGCLSVASNLGLEMSQADRLWIRCRDLIRRFPLLMDGAPSPPLRRLLESPDVDINRLDLAYLFRPSMFSYSTLLELPSRLQCQILPRYGPLGLPMFWQIFMNASSDDAYVPTAVCLVKLARTHPIEGLREVNHVLRALNDTLDANVVQIITKLCQQADCLEDFWAVVVNSDADLRMFLGCLLRIGHGNFIKKKVMAVEDKTQRSRIVNTLWNGMFFASKNQKILLTNAQTVKEVLGALSITEEIKRFAQGPKTAVEGEIFGWHEKLKKEHIQKVLKPLL